MQLTLVDILTAKACIKCQITVGDDPPSCSLKDREFNCCFVTLLLVLIDYSLAGKEQNLCRSRDNTEHRIGWKPKIESIYVCV